MGNQRNYQKEQEAVFASLEKAGEKPRLLLHACCAPCSSAVLERLCPHFDVHLFFYNPNIFPEEEHRKRLAELERLVTCLPEAAGVRVEAPAYEPETFFAAARGMEDVPEGGARCAACFRLRLERAARYAAENGFAYFTTTLSVSPLKNAALLNAIGEEMGEKYGVTHLPSDFKKRDGYKRSVELSALYGLYRQDFCGCVYSKRERETKRNG